MSNCANVLWAAVFFVLATVVSSRSSEWNRIAYQRISLEKKCIEDRVKLTSRLLEDTDGPFVVEVFPRLIKQLKQNLTMSADELRLHIDHELNDPLNPIIFNRTECKRFFNEYEKEIDDVEIKLDEGRGDALNETATTLTNVLTEIRKELDLVKTLESSARSCEGFYCSQLVNAANAARSKTFQLTSEFACSKTKYSAYVQILLRMTYNAYVKKIPDILENTKKCIRGGNLSIQNHF